MLLSIFAVIIVFAAIVIVHEWGHYIAARICGIAVPDFALGMGPTIWKKRVGETDLRLNLLPIGGYVHIAGLLGDDSEDGRTFPHNATWQAKNAWQKAFVLVNGSTMNFVFAVVCIFALGFIGFPRDMAYIAEVQENMPAVEAGLMEGDIVEQINGKDVTLNEFMSQVNASGGEELMLSVRRGDDLIQIPATPRADESYNDGKPSLGVALAPYTVSTRKVVGVQPKTKGYAGGIKIGDEIVSVDGAEIESGYDIIMHLADFDPETFDAVDEDGNKLGEDDREPIVIGLVRDGKPMEISVPGNTTIATLGVLFKPDLVKLPIGETFSRSLSDVANMFVNIIGSMGLIFKSSEVAKSVTGPVGIFSMIGQSAQSGWYTLLQMVILINISIGALNLMPLPALDGGRLVFVILNGIGIRISDRREAMVHTVGMFLLLGFIVLITISDVRSLVGF